MGDESPEKRQDDELAALKAIYENDIVDVRPQCAWKIWNPLDLLLTLYPPESSKGVHCSVTLAFKCCSNYPDKPPSISVHRVQGLSIENSNKLLDELNKKAAQYCGEVMIYQLAEHTKQFLDQHNQPILSFYEEMLKQNTEKQKIKEFHKQAKEKEERQKTLDEIRRRRDILLNAKPRLRGNSLSQDNDEVQEKGDAPELVCYADDNPKPAKKFLRSSGLDIPCNCGVKCSKMLRISQRNNKKVYLSHCIGHSLNGCTTYLAIDDESGNPLIGKKWYLNPHTDFQTRKKHLDAIQQDLKTTSRIKHNNIVPYLAMEHPKETKKQCIYIFRDFVIGSSLKYVRTKLAAFDNNSSDDLKLLRHVGSGIFSALKELHSLNVFHRDVRIENVFMDEIGNVKLVGVALDSRLSEMADGESYCDRQTSFQDINAAGEMLLSIITQENRREIPTDLPTSAKDFLSRCLTQDEHSQWSAEQLESHAFLVDAPAKQINGTQKDETGSGSEDEGDAKKIQNSSVLTNGLSRLNTEFEVLNWLGKGGFGSVMKVKNKLDGGFYAIKCIKLNPVNRKLNMKITREVKLLSRLNHENVVRYYNAWIESMTDIDEVDNESPSDTPDKCRESMTAKLGPDIKLEWSMSEGPVKERNPSLDSEDEEEDEDDCDDEPESQDRKSKQLDKISEEDSSDVEFEYDENNKSESLPSEETQPTRPLTRLKQYLYIQMEFCEKHTLRHTIDNGLYQETYRAWRLFREIVKGLAHVHQRGMIHRDLKPVNIFLDSNDHVKIGDFGLATKDLTGVPAFDSKQPEDYGDSSTGQVGTALYVAPELRQTKTKVIYNQKVDIYSLGIILFEMFHPLKTGMERIKVLSNIRTKEINMPEDFVKEENAKQVYVIRWLLNHDPGTRPTCAELLASEHVPRPVPEGALSGLIAHTLSERGSRGYEKLIRACMEQRVEAAEDLTYQQGLRPRTKEHQVLKEIVVKVFKTHGSSEFSPPLLLPRAKAWQSHPNAVKVMTASGTICHLPHDLRLPFARYIAQSGTKYMRRYTVERVYRERHVPGFHPREIVECAFDIVAPKSDSLWQDAELLVVASRAAAECNLKVSLQLNHTELLKTLLLSCGVLQDKHEDLYQVLVDVYFGRITNQQLQTHLTSLCVSEHDVATLQRLMEADVPVRELKELLGWNVKQSKWSKLVTGYVHQLEAVCRNAVALGCDCPITVAPFFAYNATQNSGVFWQMSVVRNTEHRSSKHRMGDLIAAGGRYDAVVEDLWKTATTAKDQSELKCSLVGFSMSLERIATILKKMEVDVADNGRNVEPTQICLCIWGTAGSGRDGQAACKRAQIARDLWGSGYSCSVWYNSVCDHELCDANVVIQPEDSAVRISCWGDSVREHKVQYIEVLDFIKQLIHPDSLRSSEGLTNRSVSWADNESKSNSPSVSVTYITASEKMSKRRHCENLINEKVTLKLLSLGLQPVLGRVRVNVLAIACPGSCVCALAGYMSTPLHADEVSKAFQKVSDSFTKCREILDEAVSELIKMVNSQCHQTRSTDETQLYALYSIPDNLFKLIT